jgi:threonine synthase
MRFRSTRGRSPAVGLSEAIDRGLAPDGGLYVPEVLPRFELSEFQGVDGIPDLAKLLLAPFAADDPLRAELDEMCDRALSFPIPLRPLGRNTSLLEVFHGPTAAFKDVGARFLAESVPRIDRNLGRRGRRTVIVATSGDTGGAIASAFYGKPGVDVVVLFPKGGVSARQQAQLTCWGGNVRSFALRGAFDDCQRIVKASFADEDMRSSLRLTSANSINLGRLLPQCVYHVAGALRFWRLAGLAPTLIVPSGNVGNATAALWAQAMGFPIARVVLVSNANRVIPDYFASGRYAPRPSVATLANAMDVGAPSNMERILDLYPSLDELQRVAASGRCDDATIREVIARGPSDWEAVFCPHTATGIHHREQHPEGHAICVATAHPAKFETVVEPLVGQPVPVPPALAELLERPTSFEELEAETGALRDALT